MKNVLLKSKLLLVIFSFLLLSSCSKSEDKPVTGANAYPKDVTITYKFSRSTGSSPVTRVEYANATGGQTEIVNPTLPFSVTFTKKVNYSDNLLMFVSSNGGNSLSSEILVDGAVVKSQTDSGATSFTIYIAYLFQ